MPLRHGLLLLCCAILMAAPVKGQEPFTGWNLEVRSEGRVISGPLQDDGEGSLVWLPDEAAASAVLRFKTEAGARAAWLEYQGPAPDPIAGIRVHLDLPEFGRGLSIGRFKLHWTAPTFTSDHRTLTPHSLLLLWQRAGQDDGYQVPLPLSSGKTVAELGSRDFKFGVHISTYSRGEVPSSMPVFAWAHGPDPYVLAERALGLSRTLPGAPRGKPRKEKLYPEPFRYLGWCSWNTYYQKVSAEKVLTSVASLRDLGVPIRWVLVDDGWMKLEGRKLAGFDAVETKFPGGLAPLVEELKGKHEITWVGVWHTLQGYWDGVDPALLPDLLLAGREGLYLPHPERAERFFDRWYGELARAGIDFVKVDNQARNARFTAGLLPLFEASEGLHRGLELAAERHLPGGVLNCMDMAPETAFNWGSSNLARNSEDYIPEERWNPSDHVFQNAYSALWTANFAYPDYDMFETHHPAAEFHAVARAISGGPIYTTDTPGQEDADLLRSLCLSDGTLLRVDEPAQVTRDGLLVDPSLEAIPLKLFGRVGETVLVAAFNVNKTAALVRGSVGKAELGLPADTPYACYQRSSGACRLLDDALPFSLTQQQADLFTLAPVREGVAVFGLLDKMIGPDAVGEWRVRDGELEVQVLDAGTLGIHTERAPQELSSGQSWSFSDGLLKIEVTGPSTVRLQL